MSASIPSTNPDKPLLETRHRGLLLLAVMLVSIVQFLDATIANVALPYMQNALGASSETVSWVLTSFIITTAIATPITGWLSDRIGSRNLFIWSVVVFLGTSALCGASTNLSQMVFFRAIQGLSAAFIGPMTMTIMFDISPPSKQAMTMGLFGLIVMAAPMSGPTLGGYLTQYMNWRWIFYVNLPLGIPALVLIWWLLPSRPIERRKLDILGFASLGLALGSMQLLLDRGQHRDWFTSWEIIIEGIVMISAFWVFIVHTIQTPNPLFKPALFANTNFVSGLLFMAVLGVSVIGLSAVLPMMFQTIYGYPVMDTGLLMAPRGLGVMITSLLAAQLTKKYDFRYVVFVGYLLAASGTWLMTSWSLEMESTPILTASFVQGLGFGLIVSPLNMAAFATLSPELRPDGSSLMGLFRSLGGSIGISLIVSVLARNQQISHADIAAHVTATSIPGMDLPAVIDRLPGLGGGVMTAINGEVSRQALMIAFLDNFYMLFWLLLAFAPLPLLLKKPARSAVPPPPMGE